MQPQTLNLRIVAGTGGFTVAWFVVMFENLIKSMSHVTLVALLGNSQGVTEGQHFYQATQNGALNAIIFARQS